MYITKCPECGGPLAITFTTLYFNHGAVPIDPNIGYSFTQDDVNEGENETAICLKCAEIFDLNADLWYESDELD